MSGSPQVAPEDLEAFSSFSRPLSNSVPLARWKRKQQMEETKHTYDRYITSHNQFHSLVSSDNSAKENKDSRQGGGQETHFDAYLAQSLFESDLDAKILTCKQKPPPLTSFSQDHLRVLYTANKTSMNNVKRAHRYISTSPERILDAPDLVNDYYLNLLDWSSQNSMALALQSSVFLWNPETGDIDSLFNLSETETVCSVSWMEDGTHLAVGLSNSKVTLWNVERKKQVRVMGRHAARVGSLAWKDWMLSSGSSDTNIFNHDVRIAQHHVNTLKSHSQEVCGLKWSLDGTQLASGANDNICCIWEKDHYSEPLYMFTESSAAVKALAWSPHDRHLLATGSGTADRCIRFYDTQGGIMQNSIDTNSQVCSLLWNKFEREIVSSHGFQQNQLTVWKTPSMVKVADLYGHTSRVLHTALSSDGTTIASAAADETVRFWKVFEVPKKAKKTCTEATSILRPTIR